jgi:Rieske 2Fe-2S family protein
MYLDPAVFEEEYRKIFSRQWLFVGHTSQLSAPGSYFVEKVVGESVIVVRTEDGSLRAHLNVCRHRGYRVCEGTAGSTPRFVCGYHRWTYALDGSLVGAPATPDGESGVSYRDLGLHEVHLAEFAGFLFVCLGEQRPAPLQHALAPLTPNLATFATEDVRELDREVHEVAANWKVLMENYLECHHCTGAHPELSRSMDLREMFAETTGWQGEYFGGSTPVKSGAKTVSMTGELVSVPLGTADPDSPLDVEGAGIGIVPTLTRIIVHVDHVVVHALRPVDVGRVDWHTRWFVRSSARDGVDVDVAELTRVWKATNRQDVALCEGAYAGVRSRRFHSGPLHRAREAAIHSALETYHEFMSRD